MCAGESSHHLDSSVLLVSKRRALSTMSALYLLHERYRHELYANL